MIPPRLPLLVTMLALTPSCSKKSSDKEPVQIPPKDGTKSATMKTFSDDAELKSYMTMLGREYQIKSEEQKNAGPIPGTVNAPLSPASNNETITNNQEAGVDEGGIVKNIDDKLIVLRKGRIYVTSTAQNSLVQTDSLPVASDASLNQNVWYDEMLVSGDRIYVIGYRYLTQNVSTETVLSLDGKSSCSRAFTGATEINSFRLKDGKLQRLNSSFIESYDYFSGQNYTGRMVGGKMVFYMPQQAFDFCADNALALKIPQQLSFSPAEGFKPVKPLFAATDIARNIESINFMPLFHTMVSCDLPEDGSLDCKAKAILGNYPREKYVSPTAVYLASEQQVYSLDLKNLDMRAHAFTGSPLDQFSFKESNGQLQVLVSQDQTSNCRYSLLRLPLDAFDLSGKQDVKALTQDIYQGSQCWAWKNRFIGDHILFSIVSGKNHELQVYNSTQNLLRSIKLPGYLSRLEILKDNLAFLSYNAQDNDGRSNLEVASLNLTAPELKLNSLSLGQTREGESRSHGFFQKPEADGTHVLGLPIIGNQSSPGAWWGSGLSNVAFLRVAADESISKVGAVESSGDQGVCETSCIDWYGNTRPIFLGSKVFALMGSEMQEVRTSASGLENVGPRLQLTVSP